MIQTKLPRWPDPVSVHVVGDETPFQMGYYLTREAIRASLYPVELFDPRPRPLSLLRRLLTYIRKGIVYVRH